MLAKSDIIKILEILIDSIFVMFGGRASEFRFEWKINIIRYTHSQTIKKPNDLN
jgi:hypothetical protein